MLRTTLVLLLATQGLCQAPPGEEEPQFIGNLFGSEHSIRGMLYAIDESKLRIKEFEYDGKANDTFFWVGKSDDKPSPNGYILTYPFSIHYQPTDLDAPILFGEFNGTVEINLTLPPELKVSELKWFSVWNRKEEKSYGEVIFPPNFSLIKKSTVNVQHEHHQSADSPNTELPPPLLPSNVHDPSRTSWEEPKAEPESEPEVSAGDNEHHDRFKPLRSDALTTVPSVITTVIAAIILM